MTKYKIKMVMRGSTKNTILLYASQGPRNSHVWGDCHFYFSSMEKDYDWFVAIDNIPNMLKWGFEPLQCPKENTILVTTEPSSVARYGRGFASQFHYLITNHNEKTLPHPNSQRSQTGIYWLYGKDFDDIVKDDYLPKSKLLSTICSNKRDGHTMHKKRYDFTKLMEEQISELDRYGRGFNFIEKKYQALDDYKFCVVI